MLYTREENGLYSPATEDLIFAEANSISDANLGRGELIISSDDAKPLIGWKMRHHKVEVFACLFLDNSLHCLGYEELYAGTINCNTVHPREVVKTALQHEAAAVIFAHNHPSGSPESSRQDILLTRQLINLLAPLQIRVLDHFIVGSQITSFADQNLL